MPKIIAVDDESLILDLYKAIFKENIIVLKDPLLAIDGICVYQDELEVLITDVNMPGYGINGLQLAEKIHIAYPHIRIIVVSSGFIDLSVYDYVTFIMKPFTITRLEEAVYGHNHKNSD